MSALFDSLSEELFQVLKGLGMTLTLYDETGNQTFEPSQARRVFAVPGNIMISVIEAGSDSEVKIYLSQSTDVKKASKLISTLRKITSRFNVLLNVRKFGRELRPKDFAYQASMTEAAMWGSTKTSYQKIGPTKLIIRHTVPVREGVIGSRGRNILSLFVETAHGERFKFPENHLSAGRAFAQHIAQGGKPHDETSISMVQLACESLQLSKLNRYILHSRNALDESALALRPSIKGRIMEIRKAFVTMSRPKGYPKVVEAGLPVTTVALSEDDSLGQEISRLQGLLMIDSNHALAESLMPVALLTMGEKMTNINEMFHGVITLEEAAADALVEALASEYGYDAANWIQLGSNIAFMEGTVFEDAMGYLDLVESAYQINENDVFLDYATQWTNARYAASGETGDMDSDQKKSIGELADGLRAILNGQVQIPDLPDHFPTFSPNDSTVQDRFYLDLFVSQNKLSNIATLNYVSNIIDKLAEGKKLDGAEQTVKTKLVSTLTKFMDDGDDVDETFYESNDPINDNYSKVEHSLEYFIDNFDGETFLEEAGMSEFVDGSIGPEDKVEPMPASYFIKGIIHQIVKAFEDDDIVGYQGTEGFIVTEAKDLFEKHVKPLLEQHGWNISESMYEFASEDQMPMGHGIEIGNHVSTDLGSGKVVGMDGDIATIEFMNGGVKEMHVDDMDKIGALGGVKEEEELSAWFEGFDPESVLEAPNFSNGMPVMDKAAPTNPDFNSELSVGDRVTHKAYGSGKVVALDDKNAKVAFDNAHARLPENKTVTMNKGVLTKAGAYRRPFDMDETLQSVLEVAHVEDNKIDEVLAQLREFASKVLADPESFGVDPGVGQDDVDEEEYNFKNQLAAVLSVFLKDAILELPVVQIHGEEIDEVSPPPRMELMRLARQAREESKGGFVQHVDDLGNGNYRISDWMDDKTIVSYENGRCIGGEDPLEMAEGINEAVSNNSIDTFISTDLEDDIEVTVEFENEPAEPDVNYGGGISIYSIVRKDNGEDIIDQVSASTQANLVDEIYQELAARDADRGDYEYERYRDRFHETEEVLGGDKSEDFVDDVKVDEGDAMFREELERVLKNANFRK